MQDYELDAWLGGLEVSDEQRAALLAAAAEADAEHPDDAEASERAFTAATREILGDLE